MSTQSTNGSSDSKQDMWNGPDGLERRGLEQAAQQDSIKFTFWPFVVVALAFTVLLLSVGAAGTILAFIVFHPRGEEAVTFDRLVTDTVACFGCVPSNPPWLGCNDFCKTFPSTVTRDVLLLHKATGVDCRAHVSFKQTTTCLSLHEAKDLPWSSESPPSLKNGQSYRMRMLEPFSVIYIEGHKARRLTDPED